MLSRQAVFVRCCLNKHDSDRVHPQRHEACAQKGILVILSSQNVEDFLLPGIKEYTKPLFSIPSHVLLFYPGNISPEEFMDALQVPGSEFSLIDRLPGDMCVSVRKRALSPAGHCAAA